MTIADATAPSRSFLLPTLAVAGTVFTWAASFPFIGMALREISPLPLAAVRFALAALLALAWLAWRRPPAMARGDLGGVALCGVLGIAAYNMLLNSGQATVSAGAASFIVNTQPVFMAVMAVLLLGEAFNRWGWIGTSLGLAGVGAIAWGQPGGLAFGAGSSLVLGAAVCAAAFSVLQRRLFARNGALHVTAMVLVSGAVSLLPWLPAGIAELAQASGATWGAVLFLAIAPAAIGQTCWTYALNVFGAARAGQFLYLIPPLATVLAFVLLGEVPGSVTIAGGALALAGVVLVNTRGRS